MEYFDTHCHLNHSSFYEDIDSILNNARLAGVRHILVPGWNGESSQRAVEMACKYPQILAAVGIHPTEWEHASRQEVDLIKQLAYHDKVAAIGEIGLDYYHEPLDKEKQKQLLESMLRIANECKKPVLLHSRESMSDILMLIETNQIFVGQKRDLMGVFHAFEGNLAQAQRSIDLGFVLGVGGPITYKNAAIKKDVFSKVPLDAILYETDSPYLSPVPMRGKRNEPAFLPLISQALSELRKIPEVKLSEQIYKNSNKMFLQDKPN